MRKIYLFLGGIFSFVLLTFNSFSQEAGTQLDFMTLGTGARPAGMGGAFVGVANDANSVYWNPAGMPLTKTYEGTWMHTDLDFGTTFDYVAAVAPLEFPRPQEYLDSNPHPVSRNFIGFSMVRASTGDIPITQASKDTIPGTNYPEIIYKGTASFKATTYILGYGRLFTPNFSLGMSAKITNLNLYHHSGTGYGLDLGLLYSIARLPITIGFSMQDVTVTKVKWNTEYIDEVPPNLKFGVAYRLFSQGSETTGWIPSEGITFSIGGDQLIRTGRHTRWHKLRPNFGAEWKLVNLVPLRTGWDNGNFTAGIGFISKHILLDYAYVSHQELRSTHRLSISFKL